MSIIYTPKGKAREYSPYACNIYTGCNHGCVYCYAPAISRKKREDYIDVKERRNIISSFRADCKKLYMLQSQVLFCFMTDPYNYLNNELNLTRECLKIALRNKIPVSILTKSKDVLNDLHIIKKFGDNIIVGMTLTMDNERDSSLWEPHASTPIERIKTLKKLKEEGVKTWASFEPVLDIDQSLSMINKTLDFVDLYKIGKLNNYKGLDKAMDWNRFLVTSCETLREAKKDFYIKHDLRQFSNGFKLYGNEINMDEFVLSWND